jgi:hypothetical protein
MTHDTAVHVKGYLAVFGALLLLTVITVGISYLHLPSPVAIPVGIAIALAKADGDVAARADGVPVRGVVRVTALERSGPAVRHETDRCVSLKLKDSAMACPVCFGGEDTVMRESLNAGIGVLMGVTAIVLAAFARFFIMLARRARNAPEVADVSDVVSGFSQSGSVLEK